MTITLHPGLVSVTFRKLSVREIIDLCVQAKLDGIEWGGDIHVPAGDIHHARETGQQTIDRGLKVAAYGSYYRLGTNAAPFEPVLETALSLGAPTIRVWAGTVDSQDADETYWNAVIEESRRIADLAAGAGLSISYEFHPQTLANTAASTLRLLQTLHHPNIHTYWQPSIGAGTQKNALDLSELLPWLSNVHVFYWFPDYERHPLVDGEADWKKYIHYLCADERERFVMLEFVQGDSIDSFIEDARTLLRLLQPTR